MDDYDDRRDGSSRRWKEALPPRTSAWAQPSKTKNLKENLRGQSSATSPETTPTKADQGTPQAPKSTPFADTEADARIKEQLDTKSAATAPPSDMRDTVSQANIEANTEVQPEPKPQATVPPAATIIVTEEPVSPDHGSEGISKAESQVAEAEREGRPDECFTTGSTINTTTLQVPSDNGEENNAPGSATTTMMDIIGPATEQEKENRRLVQDMREKVDARGEVGRRDPRKKKKKENLRGMGADLESLRNSESDQLKDIRHPSALPSALQVHKRKEAESGVRQHVKRMFSKSRTRTEEKPLPAIPDSGNPYDPNSAAYIHGAYIPSPVTPQHNGHTKPPAAICMPGRYQQQEQQLDPNASCYGPGSEWAVLAPSQANGRVRAAQMAEPAKLNNQMSPVTRYNQNTGIILSHGHFTTPTRYQGFATRQQLQIAHPPSQHSFVASIVDPNSPSYKSPRDGPSFVPEPKATDAEQYAAADSVEDIYNRGSEDSESTPEPTIFAELHGTDLQIRPHHSRSTSMPAIALRPFPLRNVADGAAPADIDSSLANTNTTAATASPVVTVSAVVGLVHSRLDDLHTQVNDVESRIVAGQQAALATQQAANIEMLRRMDALEAQMNRILVLMNRQGGGHNGSGRGGRGGRGGAMQARLGAMPPHIPYGGHQNVW